MKFTDSLRIRIFLFQEPVIELLADRLPLVVEFIDVPRTSMRYAHYRPERFRLALALMGFILSVAHLSRIVVENLGSGGSAGATLEILKHTNRLDLFESLGGFLGASCLYFRHDDERGERGHVPTHSPSHTAVGSTFATRRGFPHKIPSLPRTSPTLESFQLVEHRLLHQGVHRSPAYSLWASLSLLYAVTSSSRTSSSLSKPSSHRHRRLETMVNQAFEGSHRENAI